jgi:hypothetical protein
VNGHLGYFYKFDLITNGWGIPLYFKFFDEELYQTVEKEFETPEDQKYYYDNASLKPVIEPFLETLKNTSDFKFKYFLGDSEFDSYDNFGFLQQCGFEKVFIPINPRNKDTNKIGDLEYDVEDPCKGKNRSLRFKFTCPKSHRDKKGKCYHTASFIALIYSYYI